MIKHRLSNFGLLMLGLAFLLGMASGCRQEAAQSANQPAGQSQPAPPPADDVNQVLEEVTGQPESATAATLSPPVVTVIDASKPNVGQPENGGDATVATVEPTAAITPSVTPTETATPSPVPTATPFPVTLNGLALESVIYMPENVRANVHEIYARGRELGRNPQAFSKIGDSTIEKLNFLTKFDEGGYLLGDFAFLQPAIDYYAGSFGREGFAVMRGLHSWSVFDPIWANKTDCQPDETVIACEFRWHNPSVVLIRLGSNDQATQLFAESMRRIVEYSIENGVVPILATKPDRYEGEGNQNNLSIRQIAAEYEVPLWDFDLASQTLPGNGLSEDNVHMTIFYSYDYTLPEAFQRGHAIQNLTALIALYMMWLELAEG